MAGKSTFGGSIKLTGESEYQKALKNINSNLAVLSSEMKVVTSSFAKNENSVSSLNSKNEILNKKLEEQNKALSEAKKMLDEAKNSTDSNSMTVKKWETALNNAQAEVNKTTKEISDNEDTLNELEKANVSNTKELENFKNAEKEAGNQTVTFGDILKANIVSDYIVKGIDALVGKLKSITSVVGEMVIQGGIDRALNLENAKTKMSTFTKSAEQLDTIMQNVSDSVDGTAFSMDSAATVAAGLFAAGIKEGPEMESALRLVGDAAQVSGRSMEDIGAIFNKVAANGKLSGQELNQLSDSGIPVLQLLAQSTGKSTEEVRKMVSAGKIGFAEFSDAMEKGLGGAAQKSGETFTSSLANLKSACSRIGATLMTPILEGVTPVMNTLKDMLKKLASGTTDGIDELGNQLTTQVEEMIDGIITNIGPFLEKILPILGDLLTKILTSVQTALPQLLPLIVNTLVQLIDILIQNLPLILEIIIQGVLQIALALGEHLPELIPILVDALLNMVDVIIDNIDLFIDAAIMIIGGLADGLLNALPKLIAKVPTIIDKLVTKLTDPEMIGKIIYSAAYLIGQLAAGLVKAIPDLLKAIPKILSSLVTALKNGFSAIKDVGKNLINGLWEGIQDKWNALKGKVENLGSGIVSKFKNVFGIHSPSKVFKEQIGTNMALGVGEGFTDTMKDVTNSMTNAIPTDFDLSSNVNLSNSLSNSNLSMDNNYNSMVNAFKQALGEMKIQLNDEVAGNFVESTIERVIYA